MFLLFIFICTTNSSWLSIAQWTSIDHSIDDSNQIRFEHSLNDYLINRQTKKTNDLDVGFVLEMILSRSRWVLSTLAFDQLRYEFFFHKKKKLQSCAFHAFRQNFIKCAAVFDQQLKTSVRSGSSRSILESFLDQKWSRILTSDVLRIQRSNF